ncbi:hypothetical protein [Kitasatospora viridis]|uniref:LppP/LprE lipoprotein n=1 Tax=Kitasatospora viridis TaxID=281105 RepID=A0A561UN91_9ACTN|nr:hypothetical protein [Kitasatospora viridis]TWG00835.1 hypothetical protein FHX73_114715 [Kitasatospora viridis]
MPRIRTAAALLTALLALTACGQQRPGHPGAAPGYSAPASPSPAASASLCPGETPPPPPPPPPSPTATDEDGEPILPPSPEAPAAGAEVPNYQDNHRFQEQLPLTGPQRCQGLAEAAALKAALERLRQSHRTTADDLRAQLGSLGYSPDQLQLTSGTADDLAFTIDHSPVCLDGRLTPLLSEAVPYAGYSDSTHCRRPRGGH